MSSSKSYKILSDDIWRNRVEKINSEVFTLTYGSMVAQLCRDYQNNYDEINAQLFKMGYNIGLRLVEEFFAKTGLGRCSTFKETSEVITKIAFKMYLNIQPTVTNFSNDNKSFHIVFDDNPLLEFVELPAEAVGKLWYSNVLCGVLKSCLEMVQMDCDVAFVSDVLRGDQVTEMKIKLNKFLKDEVPAGEE